MYQTKKQYQRIKWIEKPPWEQITMLLYVRLLQLFIEMMHVVNILQYVCQASTVGGTCELRIPTVNNIRLSC